MVFRTWDLNFGAWIFTLAVSKTETSELWGLGNFRIWFSGHGFQDLGSELWGLGNFRISISGLGISTLGPGFSHSRFPSPKPENF
jgi:hypothetical protein